MGDAGDRSIVASISVDFQPVGRRASVPAGTTVLDAAHSVGVELAAACGGQGTCGRCRVRVVSGAVSTPTREEDELLSVAERTAGARLACRTVLGSDARIEIPPASLGAAQRLQLEGVDTDVELDPPVVARDVELAPPSLDDPRADAAGFSTRSRRTRRRSACRSSPSCPSRLRAQGWSARVALHRPTGTLAAAAPRRQPAARARGRPRHD